MKQTIKTTTRMPTSRRDTSVRLDHFGHDDSALALLAGMRLVEFALDAREALPVARFLLAVLAKAE